METKKAIGSRGSWFAAVGSESLPCVHKYWWEKGRYKGRYNDKDLRRDNPKADNFVATISSAKRVILTTGNPKFDLDGIVVGFERTGYIAVWNVDDIEFDQSGLRFIFVEKVCDLK